MSDHGPVQPTIGVTTMPIMGHVSEVVTARIRDGRDGRVAWVTVAGGSRHGALDEIGAAVLERAVRTAASQGIPLVVEIDSSGADVHDGVSALHGWGRVARVVSHASGVVPIVFVVTGVCLSGPALLLGLGDLVVMTGDAVAYVSGPQMVAAVTGETVAPGDLGGTTVHTRRTGIATHVVRDAGEARELVADLLAYLPANSLDDPPVGWIDPVDRACRHAAATVPIDPTCSYDIRTVIGDVVDADSLLEVRAEHATNLVTAFARLGGRPIGIVANQPRARAGTLDIDASRKGARFVALCDAFNVPLVTFVDTPGFEPGTDLEWRGMIRHGAQLVHAYAQATVPRIGVVVRKAFGGAYIAMDSHTIGNDITLAWPAAQIAVMGTEGAVAILGAKGLTAADYEARFLNPWRAAERGVVDAVIDPADTRRALAAALASLRTKREEQPRRKHSNIPL